MTSDENLNFLQVTWDKSDDRTPVSCLPANSGERQIATTSRRRSRGSLQPHWTIEEIRVLLESVQGRRFSGTRMDSSIYAAATQLLAERGYAKTARQCQTKIRLLKKKLHQFPRGAASGSEREALKHAASRDRFAIQVIDTFRDQLEVLFAEADAKQHAAQKRKKAKQSPSPPSASQTPDDTPRPPADTSSDVAREQPTSVANCDQPVGWNWNYNWNENNWQSGPPGILPPFAQPLPFNSLSGLFTYFEILRQQYAQAVASAAVFPTQPQS